MRAEAEKLANQRAHRRLTLCKASYRPLPACCAHTWPAEVACLCALRGACWAPATAWPDRGAQLKFYVTL